MHRKLCDKKQEKPRRSLLPHPSCLCNRKKHQGKRNVPLFPSSSTPKIWSKNSTSYCPAGFIFLTFIPPAITGKPVKFHQHRHDWVCQTAGNLRIGYNWAPTFRLLPQLVHNILTCANWERMTLKMLPKEVVLTSVCCCFCVLLPCVALCPWKPVMHHFVFK